MNYLYDVASFLRNNYKTIKLTSTQKVILYTLAFAIGKNKHTWLKQGELSDQCQISSRQLIRDLNHLLDLQLVKKNKVVTKKGKQNQYQLDRQNLRYVTSVSHSVEETMCNESHIDPPPMCHRCHIPTCHGCHMPPPENVLQLVDINNEKENKNFVKETIEINNKANKQSLVRFEEFWMLYPRKIAPKVARKKWSNLKCDKIADEIINDVKARNATEWATKEKQFIPHPATYLNQERWKDEPEGLANAKINGHSKLTHRQEVHKRNWERLKNWN